MRKRVHGPVPVRLCTPYCCNGHSQLEPSNKKYLKTTYDDWEDKMENNLITYVPHAIPIHTIQSMHDQMYTIAGHACTYSLFKRLKHFLLFYFYERLSFFLKIRFTLLLCLRDIPKDLKKKIILEYVRVAQRKQMSLELEFSKRMTASARTYLQREEEQELFDEIKELVL